MNKRGPGIKILTVAVGMLLALMAFSGCMPGKSQETIIFDDAGWDSIQVNNRIASFILEHGYGYQSKFIPGETISLFEGVARGDIDVDMECWVENQQEAYDKHIAAGDVVDLGSNFADNWQGWLVPTYVIEGDPERGIEPMAPDLKSVYDLPQYWELFKDPEDPTKGRFINGVPGWTTTEHNTQKLETYGLDKYYTDFMPGSNPAMAGSMVAAYQKGEPWLGYYWEPTWPLGRLDMTKIEEPPFDKEVWEKNRGCAYMANNVNIVVNAEWSEKHAGVVEFFRNYETTCAQNNEFLAFMQANEASTSEAAIYFLKEYESLWTEWVPADAASKVKAALP